jgi:DNA-binding NarL/FixJ family response regulator
MRIVIVDDHAIVRDGIRLMLEGDERFEIVGEANDGLELLDMMSVCTADVVVLDLRMEGMGGLQVLERLAGLDDAPAVVVLTMHDDPDHRRRAIELGARGYVLKRSGRDELVTALLVVAEGGAHVDPSLSKALIGLATSPVDPASGLDDDGITLLRMLSEGLHNRSIQDVTGWSSSQVRTRLRSLYDALGVSGRTEAVAAGLRMRLVD